MACGGVGRALAAAHDGVCGVSVVCQLLAGVNSTAASWIELEHFAFGRISGCARNIHWDACRVPRRGTNALRGDSYRGDEVAVDSLPASICVDFSSNRSCSFGDSRRARDWTGALAHTNVWQPTAAIDAARKPSLSCLCT